MAAGASSAGFSCLVTVAAAVEEVLVSSVGRGRSVMATSGVSVDGGVFGLLCGGLDCDRRSVVVVVMSALEPRGMVRLEPEDDRAMEWSRSSLHTPWS